MVNYKFFQNKQCEFFPCHEVKNEKEFNCIFCYCPLYSLKKECGGGFTYGTNGIKDCSMCTLVHIKDEYDTVIGKMNAVIEITKIVKGE